MGKSLTYCYRCSRLIREEEFVKGKAFNLGDRVSCAACAREVGTFAAPGAVPPPPPPPPPSTAHKIVVVQQPATNKTAMLAGVGAIALAAILTLGVVVFSGGSEPAQPDPGPPPASPRDLAARQAFESARKMGGDLRAKRQAMERVATNYGDTPVGAEAKKELAVLLDLSRELWRRDLQALEEKLREPAAKRKHETVIALLDEAIKLDSDPGWTEPLRKRLREAREEAGRIDPDLVGHWTFDEGQGTKAQDSSGRGAAGEVVGATWVDGQFGKALRFGGTPSVNSYVELPNSPELDTLEDNSYTIAAWVKLEEEAPPDTPYALVAKGGGGTPIGLFVRVKFLMDHWLQSSAHPYAIFPKPHPPGRFYHLAGTVDRAQGLVRIVVDGKETASKKFSPGAKAAEHATNHWRIGQSLVQPARFAYPAKGIIDDVRLYRRALTDEEIQRLISK